MGRAPLHWKVQPASSLPQSAQVPGFDVGMNGFAFQNYTTWDHSHLPKFLQVAHCSGMAELARQAFNWADFAPNEPALDNATTTARLKAVWNMPSKAVPGSRPKIHIPGYAGVNDLSQAPGMQEAIEGILGNAIFDALRPDWNWEVLDVFGSTQESRSRVELRLRETVAAGRPAIVYLTDGTKTAHAVLLYGYTIYDDRVVYQAYDSNWPGQPEQLPFLFNQAKFDHPDFGIRDPWELYPYADEK
jgi:hypothetical protein